MLAPFGAAEALQNAGCGITAITDPKTVVGSSDGELERLLALERLVFLPPSDFTYQKGVWLGPALVKRGVARGRLDTKGYGENKPMAPNSSAGGRQKNRRVEFVIVESRR